jgi:3D (Asp-Asp-Asp) domain-containing protein
MGCQGPTVTPIQPIENTAAASVARRDVPRTEEPKPLGQFNITFYYVIGEDEVGKKPAANDNHDETELTAIGDPRVTLFEAGSCKEIADVAPEFASQLAIQGTGKLKDGRVLNIWGRCACGHSPCFKVTENQWGTAGTGHPLQPFRTVAVDPRVVKLGSLLYVPLLEGRTMPGRPPFGGFVHDGCVVADDTGGHIDGNRLDLFVGRKGYFLGLSGSGSSHAWARHVPVYDGSKLCQRNGRHVSRKTGAI